MKLLILTILALSSISNAASVELIGGSLTYHLIDNDNSASHYIQKLSPDGRLIYNPLYGVRLVSETDATYKTIALFLGANSVGQPMQGAMTSFGMKSGGFYLGGVLGFYLQNNEDFRSTGSIPFSAGNIGSTGIVPVAGAEVTYKVNLTRKAYLKLNNIISPVLTNTTVSLGYHY